MSTSRMLRSAFRLASAFTLLLLASAKQLPLADLLREPAWTCNTGLAMEVYRALSWVFSGQGRIAVAAIFAGMAALSFLRSASLPEARELCVAVLLLLAFLFFAAIQTETGSSIKACAQLSAHLNGPERAGRQNNSAAGATGSFSANDQIRLRT